VNQKTNPQVASPAQQQILKLIRESAFLVLLACGLFLLGALFSYNIDDPGWSDSGSGQAVLNITGVVGAWIADFMLSIIGFMAFAFPFMLFSSSWKFLSEARTDHADGISHQVIRWVSFIVFLMAGSGLLDMHYYQNWLTIPSSPGGILGLELGDLLIELFAFQGATLILFSFFLIGITLSTGLSWLSLMDKIGMISINLFNLAKNYTADSKERKASSAAKVKRGEVFKKQSKKLLGKTKTRVEPVIRDIKFSERVEKEKQVGLFEETAGSLPTLSLLDEATEHVDGYSEAALEALSKLVEIKLQDFGVEVDVVAVHPGPVITRFGLAW
jgi:S-DNA-T family DNA segregation ATPase FtsK/SpoIIIE